MEEKNNRKDVISTERTNSENTKVPTAHKRKWWHIPFLLFLMLGTAYIIRTNNPDGSPKNKNAAWGKMMTHKNQGSIFGTFYHATYEYGTDLNDSIKKVMDEVDRSLSPFNKNSIITAVNNNKKTELNNMFTDVFFMSKKINKETDGAFDITVAPLVNAWGFGFKNRQDITPQSIKNIMQHIGLEKVDIKNNQICKTDTMVMLDCSAIAKGYGVDAVGKWLENKGIKNYMIEIGGEIRMKGVNPNGEKWRVGINKPIDDSLNINNEIQQILQLSDCSMATSGNYRNFYIHNNKKYAHTIDPRTGYPVEHNILSATVIAPDCATADAYATAFMVMGEDSTKQLLSKHPELMAYLIMAGKNGEYKIWHSDKLKASFTD